AHVLAGTHLNRVLDAGPVHRLPRFCPRAFRAPHPAHLAPLHPVARGRERGDEDVIEGHAATAPLIALQRLQYTPTPGETYSSRGAGPWQQQQMVTVTSGGTLAHHEATFSGGMLWAQLVISTP